MREASRALSDKNCDVSAVPGLLKHSTAGHREDVSDRVSCLFFLGKRLGTLLSVAGARVLCARGFLGKDPTCPLYGRIITNVGDRADEALQILALAI